MLSHQRVCLHKTLAEITLFLTMEVSQINASLLTSTLLGEIIALQ